MYTFVLVVDSSRHPFTARDIVGKLGAVTEESGGRCIVQSPNGMGDGWIAVSPFDSEGNDYDIDNFERLKKVLVLAEIRDPHFFLVEGRDTKTSLATGLLTSLDVNIKAVVDNDHGLIAELLLFKNLAAAGIDWLHHAGDIAQS